jgi:hypothetical protein
MPERLWVCVIDYVEQAIEAERRLRRGERQLYCPECLRWRWPEECAHEGRVPEAQFKAWARRRSVDQTGTNVGSHNGTYNEQANA